MVLRSRISSQCSQSSVQASAGGCGGSTWQTGGGSPNSYKQLIFNPHIEGRKNNIENNCWFWMVLVSKRVELSTVSSFPWVSRCNALSLYGTIWHCRREKSTSSRTWRRGSRPRKLNWLRSNRRYRGRDWWGKDGKSMDEYGISIKPRGRKYGTSRQLRVISSLTNSLIDPLSNPLTKLIH